MEIVIDWVKTIAATSIAGAVIYFLVPKGNTEKALRLVVSFSLLFSILSPFLSGAIKADIDFSNFMNIEEIEIEADEKAKEYAQLYSDSISEKSVTVVKENIESLLDSLKFKYSDIEIITDISEESGIVISNIKIIISEEESKQDLTYVQGEIKELTGINPEFDVSDGV